MLTKSHQNTSVKWMKRVLFLLAVLMVSGIAWSEASQEVAAQTAQTPTPVTSCAFYYNNYQNYPNCWCTGGYFWCATPEPTPSPTPEPLIFVPGISGSSLNEAGGGNLWLGGIATDRSRLSLDPQKQQANIIAPDVIRKTTIAGQNVIVYQPLLDMLTTTGDYREYKVNNDPARRTTAGCDLSQKSDDLSKNPNLFVFAYDWRKSNADNAVKLKDYVGCVQKFYPNSKINILTHSMGGLVARRYVLDNPDTHNVDKMVTIAAPWLGAPKVINTLETGIFFDSFFLDKLLAPTIKSLIEFFPGAHQLVPSQKYFNLGGNLFGEVGGKAFWDVNRNGQLDADYTPEQLTDLLDNKHFPLSKPSRTSNIFHDNPGQDDWRTDQSGIQYYHIYGVQYFSETIGKVLGIRKKQFNSQGDTIEVNTYSVVKVQGDGTVPLLSAERIGYGQNLNASGAIMRPFSSGAGGGDSLVEHTGLTQNPKVWDAILAALRSNPQQSALKFYLATAPFIQKASYRRERAQTPSQNQQPTVTEVGEAYYLNIGSVDDLLVTDASGNNSSQLSGIAFQSRLPEVDVSMSTDYQYNLGLPAEMPSNQSYTVTFRSIGKPIEFELVRGKGNAPEAVTQIIRYMDLNLPKGTAMLLKVTPQGVEDLRYDKDGDGTFESTIAPTASAIGSPPLDMEAPTIAFSEKLQGTKKLVTITAEDKGSGVKIIRYSLDGKKYQPYTSPLVIDPAQTPMVSVIADDNLANRSDTITYKPLMPAITLSRDGSINEIIATLIVTNSSTASVTANISINSAKLGSKATITTLPVTIGTLAAGEAATRTFRFPGTAAVAGAHATLSGAGSENGGAFGGSINITVP